MRRVAACGGARRAGNVHDDLAGALHDVGIVEALVALRSEAARARLGQPVMLSGLVGATALRARFTIRGRLPRTPRRSVRRSVRGYLSGRKRKLGPN